MDSDLDDALDDLLADITDNEKKQSPAPPPKGASSEPKVLQKAKKPDVPLHSGDSDILGGTRTTKKNSRSFMDDLLSGRNISQKAETTKKDPLSDIFEKGAWKQAVQQQNLAKDSEDDIALKRHQQSDGAEDIKKKQERTYGVRFSDTPQFEPQSTKASPASKLEDWLQEGATDLDFEIGSTKTPRTATSRDVDKTSPDKASSAPSGPRQRGVVDLSFLGTTSDHPDQKTADGAPRPQQTTWQGTSTDWLGLADEQKNSETAKTSSTRPNTAPDISLSAYQSRRGEDTVLQNRRTRGLDWLELGEEVQMGHKTSAQQGGETSGAERRLKASSSLDDLGQTSPGASMRGTKKALPWLSQKPEKLGTIEQVDKQRDDVTESQHKMQVFGADVSYNREDMVKHDCARNEEIENIIAQLRTEVASLNSELQVAEQEKAFFLRQIDKLKEMQQTEVQTCEEMYKRLQMMTESRLAEQHEKTVAHYESHIRQMEQKVANLDLERVRLEREIGQRTERLRQQCKEEVNALQEMHKMAVTKLKAEHEEEIQRVKRMRNQEMEAVCSTLDQSRNLQDITAQMNQQQSEMKLLQSKLEETVDSGLSYRQNALDSKERQLRALEARLRREHDEMKEELRQARDLMAYLQQLNSQQTQQVEEEKWKLKQEVAQLQAYKKAQEEKANLLEDQMQRQRATLELMKNNLLREQQNLVSQVASSLKETSREREKANFVAGRMSDEVRAARLENRQREIDATTLELNVKRRDVENMSVAANQLWEKCKKRECFLATWEAQLYARESALLKEKVCLLQQKRNMQPATTQEKP